MTWVLYVSSGYVLMSQASTDGGVCVLSYAAEATRLDTCMCFNGATSRSALKTPLDRQDVLTVHSSEPGDRRRVLGFSSAKGRSSNWAQTFYFRFKPAVYAWRGGDLLMSSDETIYLLSLSVTLWWSWWRWWRRWGGAGGFVPFTVCSARDHWQTQTRLWWISGDFSLYFRFHFALDSLKSRDVQRSRCVFCARVRASTHLSERDRVSTGAFTLLTLLFTVRGQMQNASVEENLNSFTHRHVKQRYKARARTHAQT